METKIIIAGFGGQGVLSLGKMICLAADRKGLNATFFPSYGGEQRGGTCNCTVVLSQEPIGSPVATRADYIMIMNVPSYDKFKDSVLPGGTLLYNSSQIHTPDAGAHAVAIEVDSLADEAGNRIAANMVMFGAFTAVSGFAAPQDVEEIIRESLQKKPQHLQTNLDAFHAGLACIK